MAFGYNEADTRAKLIDPVIHRRGWTEELIRREESAGAIEILGGKARRRARGRADYLLRVKVTAESQPVAVALIEAKKDALPPGHGLDQAKGYATCRRLNVPFVYSSNGHQFVEFDSVTGLTSRPQPLAEFPKPDELRARYEEAAGFSLAAPEAKALLQPYAGGEGARRYYQDAAIRAVFEKFARCARDGQPRRALLSLATGSGKTFIAVNLLKRAADAGELKRAIFVCDRDELRSQALRAFQNVFGADAAEVFRRPDGSNNARNARIHIATYQTLGIDTDNGNENLLQAFYPENYFTHVVIDECHRSAWGKWSHVLTRNADAAQIGLTATPRKLADRIQRQATCIPFFPAGKPEDAPPLLAAAENAGPPDSAMRRDADICADNFAYFGEPAYDYDIAQAMDDGYLAACAIERGRVNLDETGITREDIVARNPVDAVTGQPLSPAQIDKMYREYQYEDQILLPDRVLAMCTDLFHYLIETGGPEQKTIIFCARDRHADDVAACMNNLYAHWCAANGRERLEHYAFKCTAASSGNDQLPDLRASNRSHFIATTVDLLTTGVDVPCVRNIVFFRYLQSPISFHQMLGRGTRIDTVTGKLMFRVYDYTDATHLFAEEFISRDTHRDRQPPPSGGDVHPAMPVVSVDGFDVHVTPAGSYIVADIDGRATPVPVAEYKALLAARLIEEARTLDGFRKLWIDPPSRKEFLDGLVAAGRSPWAHLRFCAGRAWYG